MGGAKNGHPSMKTTSAVIPVLVILLLFFISLGIALHDRKAAKQRIQHEQITTTTGTVLHAECTFDPATKIVQCDSLVVQYRDPSDTLQTRTFVLRAHMNSLAGVPQIGSRVVVSWPNAYPENVQVMRLDDHPIIAAS